MIEIKTVYIAKGQQFDTFQEAVNHHENLVEEFLRSLPGYQDIPLRSRVPFVASLIRRRHELIDLLMYRDQEPEND